MKKKVLIYVGNGGGQLRAGLGPWNRLADWKKKSLLEQDPQAERKVLSLEEIFEGKHAEPVEVSSYEECLEHIATAHVLAVCKGTVDSAMIGRAERLESVHILGEDTGHIDLLALHDKKVHVHTYPLTNFTAVAEHTFALMLSLLKKLSIADQTVREGSSWMVVPGNVPLVHHLTIGVLGAGEIGQAFLRLLSPWKARLLYHDINRQPMLEEETGAVFVEWDDIFEQSDVVSVHLADDDRLIKRIGAKEFSLMKKSAHFINTARGKLVDGDALLTALQNGQIAGAALDVFEKEPLPVTHPLTTLPNVHLTPHMAWGGPWTLVNDAHQFLRGVANSLQDGVFVP